MMPDKDPYDAQHPNCHARQKPIQGSCANLFYKFRNHFWVCHHLTSSFGWSVVEFEELLFRSFELISRNTYSETERIFIYLRSPTQEILRKDGATTFPQRDVPNKGTCTEVVLACNLRAKVAS